MAAKRSLQESTEGQALKKARKGFRVGPQNLPDGTYKRKADKIRRKLVENAKIRKSYDRLKAREQNSTATSNNNPENATEEQQQQQQQQPSSIARHPDRQALIDNKDQDEKDQEDVPSRATGRRPRRHHKQPLFQGDLKIAEARKKESDRRRKDMAAARLERDKRLAERERWRRTMANARGDGKRRKLGKESTVLLEKVQRMLENEISVA
ncbi:MAG: hypothetical protein GOMPHAMPRED_001846 [Gomphillus americanus]|uniref:rRNA-processing protein FYV7 n=1 Tax=Gomphillus americanus TaxID=1940652 RepID=A0A8H3II31_9LECA|nr:MAG: hypothetical protein GOMPHAMPRED_001846 [Gomphillus americanus]